LQNSERNLLEDVWRRKAKNKKKQKRCMQGDANCHVVTANVNLMQSSGGVEMKNAHFVEHRRFKNTEKLRIKKKIMCLEQLQNSGG
jgi:hypothetical protein